MQDTREIRETTDSQDLMGNDQDLDCQDVMVPLAQEDERVNADAQEYQDLQEFQVERSFLQVQWIRKDPWLKQSCLRLDQEFKEIQVVRDHVDHTESVVIQEDQENQEHLETLDLLETRDHLDHQEMRETLVFEVHLDSQENRENLVQSESKAHLDDQVLQVTKE